MFFVNLYSCVLARLRRKPKFESYRIVDMLNKVLFDKKDVEIARLKRMIERFKEYDKERKNYYAEKMQRLGELESFVQELDTDRERNNMQQTILKLKEELTHANRALHVRGIEEKRSSEELKEIIALDSLRIVNKNLRSSLKKLNAVNDELWTKIRRLEGELERKNTVDGNGGKGATVADSSLSEEK